LGPRIQTTDILCKYYRPLTAREIAINGLTKDPPKKLHYIDAKEKERGIAAGEKVVAGDFVCEYKYNKSYSLRENPQYDEEYAINDEGCYSMKFSFLLTRAGCAWMLLAMLIHEASILTTLPNQN
jgi:hypothetical protein